MGTGSSLHAAAAEGEVASCSWAMTTTSGRRWLKDRHSRLMDWPTRRSTASRVAFQGSRATAELAACAHLPATHGRVPCWGDQLRPLSMPHAMKLLMESLESGS